MIIALIENIREICNHPWKKELIFEDQVKWNKLWTSLDTIDDTQRAINTYLNLPEFRNSTEGYLYVYGVMQALNIQQDSLNNLLYALFSKKINWEKEYPKLYEIREHRNNSVGHPTNRGNDKSFHLIGRMSLSKESFTLSSYFPKTGKQSKFEEINILKCIEIQANLIPNVLKETMIALEKEFIVHKEKFKDDRLSDLIPSTIDYHFQKLYDSRISMVSINFELIKESYYRLMTGIKSRYYSVSALSGVEIASNKIDYLLDRLNKDLIDDPVDDEIQTSIFIEALKKYFKELQEMVAEIDKDFE
ncbi:hypothetical protein V5097_07855 [Arenibacter palladensis]|uniref:hypothetical protein n=1 Tax=Arenibacter palladensis TaxID=237373 RepID=UPI002FD4ED7B